MKNNGCLPPQWYMTPKEAAAEDLLKACKALLIHIALTAPDRISPKDQEIIDVQQAIFKADGK